MFESDIYLYSALHKIVAKQLHVNKQENNSVNVVKLIGYESNSVSAVKQLSYNSVILQKLFAFFFLLKHCQDKYTSENNTGE